MSAEVRTTPLARLQVRRKQIERELARLDRKIARASDKVVSLQERITNLTQTARRAA